MEYPISEVEIDDDDTTVIAYLNILKIVRNSAGGDCLFYVVRQHIKAFNCFEYRVDTLRRRVAEYLLTNELGKEFLNEFHQTFILMIFRQTEQRRNHGVDRNIGLHSVKYSIYKLQY